MSHEPGVGPFPLASTKLKEDRVGAVNTRALMEEYIEERMRTVRGCVIIVQVSIANFVIIGWDLKY